MNDLKEIGRPSLIAGQLYRLGRASWSGGMGQVSLQGPRISAVFDFSEQLRPDARECCDALRAQGLDLAILSGDGTAAVDRAASELGISKWQAELLPGQKLDWLNARRASGRKVLMVGDGLNDSPALAAAHASISPSSAADVAKTAAGLVFTGKSLIPVLNAVIAATTARRRAFQCFAIAAVYNAIAIPLALAGLVTPLLAAAAMSASSVLVILNAIRKDTAK